VPRSRRAPSPEPSSDPSAWLPQPFGRRGFREIADPLIEPHWGGVRVLARIEREASGTMVAALADEIGEDRTKEFAAIAQAVAAALCAEDAILDGYLTVEPTQETVGVMPDGPAAPTRAQIAAQFFLGRRPESRRPERETRPRPDPDCPIAFVAVDLLRIDGTNLIGQPLQERKRLLEGALATSDLVRVTPCVRPPIDSQARTWFAQGFREMAYKPANGRYRPTGEPSDWATAPIRSG
jgi:ATP-dependent DNA ligase